MKRYSVEIVLDHSTLNGALTPNPIIEGGAAANMLGGQGESVSSFGPPVMTFPTAIGVPMQSTTTCYGPWQSVGRRGRYQIQFA